MALVKVISDNLYSGANLKKLEVGSSVEVDDATAERWIAAGLAESGEGKKDFEVATPDKPKKGK